MNYGGGKALNTFRATQRHWDLHLSFGEYDHELIKFYTQSVIVGNPKFDDWFNDDIDKNETAHIKTKLDSKKKTVLYLPTHSDLSSIKQLSSEINKLSENYNVIVKLHYYTVAEEPERIKLFDTDKVVLFMDHIDLLPLLKISDVIVSDNSSAIFDAILVDKPLVTTSFLSDKYLDHDHRIGVKYRRGNTSNSLTFSGSIEQIIKKEGQVHVINDPKKLEDAISEALQDHPFFQENRKKIRERVFSFNDGRCGERAAEELRKIATAEELPGKPVLYHIIERLLASKSKNKQKTDEAAEHEEMMSKGDDATDPKKMFSVIMMNQNDRFLAGTLKSLMLQDLAHTDYEINLRDTEAARKSFGNIISELSLMREKIPEVIFHPGSLSEIELIKRVTENTDCDYICFIDCGCLAYNNWLKNHSAIYGKNSMIGGIGGFVSRYRQAWSCLDEYYYSELADKLGLPKKEKGYLRKLYRIRNRLWNQNPAGNLKEMSYRKSIVSKINFKNIISRELLEMELKKECLKSHDIFFTAMLTGNIKKLSIKEFIINNFREGQANRLFIINNPQHKDFRAYTFSRAIRTTLSSLLDGYPAKRFSRYVFVGNFCRAAGFWYSFFTWKFSSKDK